MKNTTNIRGSLILDASILSLLLDRNRKQHFRTQYFRRLDMLIRSMKRCQLINIESEDSLQTIEDILLKVRNEHERVESLLARYKGIHKRRGKVEDCTWSLEGNNSAAKKAKEDFRSPFLKNLSILYTSITKDLPEILSRINHAASALYVELSRGFFVPLCTTALACISRIRTLVMNLGRDILHQVRTSFSYLNSEFLPFVSESGELESSIEVQVSEARYIVQTCVLPPDLLNHYIELDQNHYSNHMRKRKMKRLESFSNKFTSTVSGLYDDSIMRTSDETSSDILPNTDASESLVGEKISENYMNVHIKDENEAQSNNCDRNLELVTLLKAQKTSLKKRKDYDDMTEHQDHEEINVKDSKLLSIKSEEKKKMKKSKKKKKKNVENNVIDDIFDGF